MSTLWQNAQVVREVENVAGVTEPEKSLAFKIIPVRDATALAHVLHVEAQVSYKNLRIDESDFNHLMAEYEALSLNGRKIK